MKNIYITVSFIIASSFANAQNSKTKYADKLFDRYEFIDAANEYLKLIDKANDNPYLYQQLAESYYNVFNSKEAVKWYQKLTQEEQNLKAETYYKYAQMLKAEGNYDLANQQMQKFAELQPNDKRAQNFKNNPNYLNKLQAQKPLFDINPSDLSSDKSDFGAVLANDNTIYFTSSRNDARKKHGWNEEPYLDLYKATYNQDGSISEATLIDEINTKWHDGPATVTADGNTLYFTSESFNENEFEKVKEKKVKISRMYLYKATKTDGKWGNVKALPINSKDYSLRNPSISNDGKTLYFSSDMPGGIGGEDIWRVSVENDQYGTPENLGENINTAGNESFPSITKDNVLYFTSDSRQGFGGYDVFFADLNKNNTAINLGEPVNTSKDDFAFNFNTEKEIAIFSSNRNGVDNLYLAHPLCGVNAIVVVKNAETRKPIEEALINVLDPQNNIAYNGTTNPTGQKTFEVECKKEYTFNASKQGYEDASAQIPASNTNNSELVEIYLNPIKPVITEKEVILLPIFFEFNKSNITAEGAQELDKLIVVMNENPEMVIFAKSHTDSRGNDKYNLKLSDRRAKATVQYIISKGINPERISGQGFGESEPKVNCDKCTEEEHSQNRRSEFLIIKK